MDNIYIGGVGSTTFGQHPNRTAVDLAVEASLNAIEDANVELDKIGTIYLGNFVSGVLTGQEVLAGLVADKLGISGVPATKVEAMLAWQWRPAAVRPRSQSVLKR
jgi:acetyl-CoA C-acetyltransferase